MIKGETFIDGEPENQELASCQLKYYKMDALFDPQRLTTTRQIFLLYKKIVDFWIISFQFNIENFRPNLSLKVRRGFMIKQALTLILLFTSILFAQTTVDHVLFMDGDGDYIQLTKPVINSDSFTIEGHAFMKGPGGGLWNQNPIYVQRGSHSSSPRSLITLWSENQNKEFSLNLETPGAYFQAYKNPMTEYGEWHHYAAVVTKDTVSLYLDGIKIHENSYDKRGDYLTNIEYVEIGRHYWNNSAWGYFNGMINELRIWNKALAESEIMSIMSDTINYRQENDLAAYWRFDSAEYIISQNGTYAKVINDLAGNGNNGILKGDATLIRNTSSLSNDKIKINTITANNQSTVIVPININYTTPIRNLTLLLSCNNELATISKIELNTLMAENAELFFSNSNNDWFITIQSDEDIYPNGDLLYLKVVVHDTTNFIPITLKSVEVGGLTAPPIMISGGIIYCSRFLGDIDGNNSITDNDAEMILDYLVNLTTFDSLMMLYSDVNLDGAITAFDASQILQYTSGHIPTIPYYDETRYKYNGGFYFDYPVQYINNIYDIPIYSNGSTYIYSIECEIKLNTEKCVFNQLNLSQQIDKFRIVENPDNTIILYIAMSKPLIGNSTIGYLQLSLLENTAPFYDLFSIKKISVNSQKLYTSAIEISKDPVPSTFVLKQNYPNPFNSETRIEYIIAKPGHVAIEIYNINGQKIKTLVNTQQSLGKHFTNWDGMDSQGVPVSSGVYFAHIKTGDFDQTIKMLYTK